MRGLKKHSSLVGKSVILRIFLLCAIAIFSIQAFQNVAKADQFSWTSSDPTYNNLDFQQSTQTFDASKNCIDQQVFVSPDTQPTSVCVYQKDNFRYGSYVKTHNLGMWNQYTESKLVVGIGSDSKMYKVNNASNNPMPLDLSTGRDLIYRYGCGGCAWGGNIYIYQDFVKNLTHNFNFTDGLTYDFNNEKLKVLRFPDNDEPIRINRVDSSENGKWLIMEVLGRGLMTLNLDTMEMKQISGYNGHYGVGLDPRMEMAITNDGSHVAVAGQNVPFFVYDINDNCGRSVDSNMSFDVSNSCPVKQLDPIVHQQYPDGYFSINKPSFSSDSGELTFYVKEQQNAQTIKQASLSATGYVPIKLDYLALGDSFSSGEGDIEKNPDTGHTYYLSRTNDPGGNGMPRETCHISSRSYPFQLATAYNISDKTQSIACSGAETKDMRYASKYIGQNNRLKVLSPFDRLQWQGDALASFVPGRIEQIRFVSKYQPKAITLTVGGNDVDFGSRINKCASSGDICEYVTNSKSRAKLGYEIQNQFENLKSLYLDLHKASPKTKIYVLDYPSFINPEIGQNCRYDDGYLKSEEKTLIDESIKYMNATIKNATEAAGVNYIDIYSSLIGGRICDSSGKYVTSLQDVGLLNSSQYYTTFHPNNQGHQKIAKKIQNYFDTSNLIDYNNIPDQNPLIVAPDPTEYFSTSMSQYLSENNSKHTIITADEQTKTQAFDISLDEFSFGPGEQVDATIHSIPTDLGTFTSASDGAVNATLTIPESVSTGLHTLILSGKSYSGEPIELYQTVLVKGTDPNDIDEDGILDNLDSCLFISPIGVDADNDGLDDMCDPEIGESKPYRARNGNINKGENAEHIYIERNTQATSFTGISGDSDPDGDGWAIVAQSTKPANSGTPAHFWIDDNKIPHVSTRTNDEGCVQFTPRSLKVVKANKLRKLKQEAKNTNTCRSEPISADIDSDGVPDNQQPLYRAHNGIAANGEDVNSIYLERNSVAAEAQLGLSDYSHSNSWNILAFSQNDTTKANFAKLVMVTDENGKPLPTILANQTKVSSKGKITITCIALQPQNTNIITVNNQDRKLKKAAIQQGGNCE